MSEKQMTMAEQVALAYAAKVKIIVDDDNGPLIVNPLEAARAAIEAMREPSEPMEDAYWGVQGAADRAPCEVALGAMIDAALKE